MFFKDLLIAFLVASLLALVLSAFSGARPARFGGSAAVIVLFFFLILFLTTWAGGLWIRPFGPPLWGAYWLPFVVVGVFIALILAATGEPSRRFVERRVPPEGGANVETTASVVAFGLVFWVLIGALLIAIVARYVVK